MFHSANYSHKKIVVIARFHCALTVNICSVPERLLKGMMTFHVVVVVVDVVADVGVAGSSPVAADVAGDVAG